MLDLDSLGAIGQAVVDLLQGVNLRKALQIGPWLVPGIRGSTIENFGELLSVFPKQSEVMFALFQILVFPGHLNNAM